MEITLADGKVVKIDDSVICKLAYDRWLLREKLSIPGSPEDDWNFAKEEVKLMFVGRPDEIQPKKLDDALERLRQSELEVRAVEQRLFEATSRQPAPLPQPEPFVFESLPDENPLRARIRQRALKTQHRAKREREVRRFFLERMVSFIPNWSVSLRGVAAFSGCGPSTIALLTGEHPLLLKQRYMRLGITENDMVAHLQDKQYEVTQLTNELLKTSHGFMDTPIDARHVVLLSMRATADKNTWVVLWGKNIWHNWSKTRVTGETFVNHRILNSWLLWHPTWVSDHLAAELLRTAKHVDEEKVKIEDLTIEDSDREHQDNDRVRRVFGFDETELAEADDDLMLHQP